MLEALSAEATPAVVASSSDADALISKLGGRIQNAEAQQEKFNSAIKLVGDNYMMKSINGDPWKAMKLKYFKLISPYGFLSGTCAYSSCRIYIGVFLEFLWFFSCLKLCSINVIQPTKHLPHS